jgi:hypothetical protein
VKQLTSRKKAIQIVVEQPKQVYVKRIFSLQSPKFGRTGVFCLQPARDKENNATSVEML